jgi:hypothetical protein
LLDGSIHVALGRMRSIAALGALVTMYVVAGCSNDAKPSNAETADASTPAPDAAPTRKADPFNGDCTSANWSSGSSDACWACMCNTCAMTLNACNDGCISLLACGLDKHVIVGSAADLQCEIRAFTASCLDDPSTSSQANAVTALDTCLIGSHKPPEMLRACEAECGITYTGDVCQRFPAPEGGSN